MPVVVLNLKQLRKSNKLFSLSIAIYLVLITLKVSSSKFSKNKLPKRFIKEFFNNLSEMQIC